MQPDGTPNHPQPESKLIDLNELRVGDGWMIATSPAGRAEYQGVKAWSPSARTGDMPPEIGQSGGEPRDEASDDDVAGTDDG